MKAMLLGTAVVLSCPCYSALAQTPAPSSETTDQLPQVVVTAERRNENLQTTAIAATVLSGDDLAQKGVVGIADLQNASPSLSITNSGLSSNVNIRGIGLDSGSPSVVPGVATYRDGLWVPSIVTGDTLYDMGSVEVLRGPQGTFVGSNSTGGAIFLNSRSPDLNGLHGEMQLQGGDHSDFGATGGINLPVSDKWAARVAFDVEERDSFYKDVGSKLTPGPALFGHPGSLDEKNVRLGLLGKPTDDLTILLKAEVDNRSTGGYAYRPVPGTLYAAFANPDPFTIDYDHDTQNDELAVRASLKIDWNIGGSGVILRSVTGDQFLRVNNIYDTDGTSASLAAGGPPSEWETQHVIERPVTEEINLLSPDGGPLKWVLGAYYLHDTRVVDLDIASEGIPNHILLDEFETVQSEAAFGQVNWQFAKGWELQAGVRYTRDTEDVPSSSYVQVQLGIPGVPDTIAGVGGSQSDSTVTGKVALNWTVDDRNFLYAFAAKGAKAGGFNAGGAGFPQTNFAPESVWDYELGWKTEQFDHHLRASVGAFWNDYTNLQVNALNPSTAQASLINTGRSTIKGAELELHANAAGLSFDLGGAYVKSRLGSIRLINTEALPAGVSLPQCTNGQVPPACFDYTPYALDLDGSANPYSPEWTFNASLQYAFPFAGGVLIPRVNYSYVGAQWTTLFELPATDRLSAFGLWSANVTWQAGDWRVQVYGLNLADKLYVAGQLAAGSNPDSEFLGNPRQIGVRVARSF